MNNNDGDIVGKSFKNLDLIIKKDELFIDVFYPRSGGTVKYINVGVVDKRVIIDDIRISFDFDRNGWTIEQASAFEKDWSVVNRKDPDWQEVAFLQAWAREKQNL